MKVRIFVCFFPCIIPSARKWELGGWLQERYFFFFWQETILYCKVGSMCPYLRLQFPDLFKSFSSCQLTYGRASPTAPRWKVVCLWSIKYLSVQVQEWRELSEKLFSLTLLPFKVGRYLSKHSLTDLAVFLWDSSNQPCGSPCGLATSGGGEAKDTTACCIEIASEIL